ncbi:MAG: methylated-DNA--[protein]-cysteine S-methyltransferase [Solirubrobacteraceae bacterium]
MIDLAPPSATGAAEAAVRFAATAPADVHYAVVDTPVGRIVAARTEHGLARLAYEDFNGGTDAILEGLAQRISPRILEGEARFDDVRRELDEYFAGTRTAFDLPLDFSYVKGAFGRRILEACATIPFGEISSYGAMAAQAGSAKAVRAAGNALGANPIPIVVPCHRVLRTSGGLGGYTGGIARKEKLLRIEGVLA